MIDRTHELPITQQAKLLDISRGAVYYQPRPISAADLTLMRHLDELHLQFPFMGVRMLRRELQKQGLAVGRQHLDTLMRRRGIEALVPKPGTSKAAPGHKIYPYLLRQLAITAANQVWALDTDLHPDATWLRLSHGSRGCGQPPGARAQTCHHPGGLSRGRSH